MISQRVQVARLPGQGRRLPGGGPDRAGIGGEEPVERPGLQDRDQASQSSSR